MSIPDDKLQYIVRETSEWASRVMGTGDIDLPDLVGVVIHFALSAVDAVGTTDEQRNYVVIRLLTSAAAALLSHGVSYADTERALHAVGRAVGAFDPTIRYEDASTVLGALMPKGVN